MQAFLRTYADGDLQQPMDAAVVIPTVLRPHLAQSLQSVFAQRFSGRIHILVGVDSPQGDPGIIDAACAARPSHCVVQVLWPGFSTSVRHGGLTPPGDGGALRSILTYLANATYVAYLDDDNWWDPNHLQQIRTAAADADWAFALRWYVHPDTRRPVCVDVWESVGPGQGVFNDRFGGFVDPSCLMINKLACPLAPHRWNFPLSGDPMSADRSVFAYLSRNHKARGTGRPTVFYTVQPKDGMHALRLRFMGPAYEQAGDTTGAAAG
jgi:glycosyltransferase involved in cell wall biosynthesis